MKTLWLIRHAKSSWNDLNVKDFDRPLNKRGKNDAPQMGMQLAQDKDRLEVLLSSPAKRAISTAKLIATAMQLPSAKIIQNHLIYDAALQDLLELIYKLDDELNLVGIVGHNPGLTVLSDYLSDYYIDNIPTCGVVKIQFNISSWKEIIKGSGEFKYFRYPKEFQED